MPLYRLIDDNFNQVLQDNEFVIVDFWAEWCSTCSSFTPIFMQISDKYPEVVFGRVNTQIEQDISTDHRIQSIPTLIVFQNGVEVYRKIGAIPSQFLEDLIISLKNKIVPT